MSQDYVACDCGNLMTAQYADQYGQCASCYLPLDVKLYRAFGRGR